MTAPELAPRQKYLSWVDDQIEEFKSGLSREELLDVAEEAMDSLLDSPDGQIPLTEILLCDAVDSLLFTRLGLPDFRQWHRAYQTDTLSRHRQGTVRATRAAG